MKGLVMRSKPKYETVAMPWERVTPGMLMACAGGFDRVVNCARLQDGRWQMSFERQQPVIASAGNWPLHAIPYGQFLAMSTTYEREQERQYRDANENLTNPGEES